MSNVATWSIRATVKDDVTSSMNRIKSLLGNEMRAVGETMADPVKQAQREFESLLKTVEQLGRRATSGSFFSDKHFRDLDNVEAKLRSINNLLAGSGTTGAGLSSNVSTVSQFLGSARGMAIAHPNSMYSGPAYNVINVSDIQGPSTYRPKSTAEIIQAVRGQQFLAGSADPLRNVDWSGNRLAETERRNLIATGGYAENYERLLNQRTQERIQFERDAAATRPGSGRQERLAWNRQADAYNRFLNPYGKDATLSPAAGIYAQQDQMALEYSMRAAAKQRRMDDAYSTGRGATDYSGNDKQLRLDTMKQLTSEYDKQDKVLDHFTSKYSTFNKEQITAERNRLRAAQEAGVAIKNLGIRQEALDIATNPYDPRNKTGIGSFSHSFRYGVHNAAFALEDFMISSQYGGPAAGIRAITNNLTAIAGAAGMAMTPLASGALIAGTAIAGAGAAYYLPKLMGESEEDKKRKQEERAKEYHSWRDQQNESRMRFGFALEDARNDFNASFGLMNAAERRRKERLSDFRTAEAELDQLESQQPGMQFKTRAQRKDYADQVDKARIKHNQRLSELEFSRNETLEAQAQTSRITDRSRFDFNQLAGYRSEQVGFAIRSANGELVSPQELYRSTRSADNIRFNNRLQRASSQVEQNQIIFERDMLYAAQDNQLKLDQAQYQRRVLDRGISFSSAMNQFQVDPTLRLSESFDIQRRRIQNSDFTAAEKEMLLTGINKDAARAASSRALDVRSDINRFQTDDVARIKEDFKLQRERLELSLEYTKAEKDKLLAGINKAERRAVDVAEDMPALGMAADVGSVADVSMRQKYFNRMGGADSLIGAGEQKLGDILKELQEINRKTKSVATLSSKRKL